MSGKYQNSSQKKKKSPIYIWLLLAAALIAGSLLLLPQADPAAPEEPVQAETNTAAEEQTAAPELEETAFRQVQLGFGLQLDSVNKYTGIFMEDGSDEVVSGVLSIVVTNTGDEAIQYAQVIMNIGEEAAQFKLTTLGPGERAVLLEQNRMAYDSSVNYSDAFVAVNDVAVFAETPTAMEDTLRIGILDGVMNVTNISGEDITGNITIYYKNMADGMYYGGITYRMSIDGGLKAEEIRQLVGSHLSETGSHVVFVTITG